MSYGQRCGELFLRAAFRTGTVLHIDSDSTLNRTHFEKAGHMRQKTEPDQLGTISDDTTYPLAVFQKTAGIGKHALSQLRRQGLRVIRTGGRAYVRGVDFSSFLATLSGNPDTGSES